MVTLYINYSYVYTWCALCLQIPARGLPAIFGIPANLFKKKLVSFASKIEFGVFQGSSADMVVDCYMNFTLNRVRIPSHRFILFLWLTPSNFLILFSGAIVKARWRFDAVIYFQAISKFKFIFHWSGLIFNSFLFCIFLNLRISE